MKIRTLACFAWDLAWKFSIPVSLSILALLLIFGTSSCTWAKNGESFLVSDGGQREVSIGDGIHVTENLETSFRSLTNLAGTLGVAKIAQIMNADTLRADVDKAKSADALTASESADALDLERLREEAKTAREAFD